MTADLFPIPESLSPKLAWLRANGLRAEFDPRFDGTEESPETGETVYPWLCGKLDGEPERYGVGMTDEDAIWDYCRKNDLTHYSLS